jgi:hypothetical protein
MSCPGLAGNFHLEPCRDKILIVKVCYEQSLNPIRADLEGKGLGDALEWSKSKQCGPMQAQQMSSSSVGSAAIAESRPAVQQQEHSTVSKLAASHVQG